MRNETRVSDPARRTPEWIEARITCRVSELEVIAARTALRYARMRTREAWAALDRDGDHAH